MNLSVHQTISCHLSRGRAAWVYRGQQSHQRHQDLWGPWSPPDLQASRVSDSNNINTLQYQSCHNKEPSSFLTVLDECDLPLDGRHHGVRAEGVQVGARKVGGAAAQHFLQVHAGVQLEPGGSEHKHTLV